MRVRGLIVLSVIALVVPAIAGTGANAADDCGIGTTGILSIDNAIAATPPCAKLDVTPQKAVVNSTFTFDASASTGGGDPITKYEWDWGNSNDQFTEDSGTTAIVPHVFTTPGVYNVRVKVTSGSVANGFASQIATKSVVVWPDPNNPPTASVTTTPPATIGVPQSFDASASTDTDPGGAITSYEWDWDNNGTYDETTTTPTAQHTFSTSGSATVGLRVTDERPDTPMQGTTTVSFPVTTPPVAEVTATPNQISPGGNVHFDGSASSDPDGGAITKYEWDFDGNGTYDAFGTSPTIDHVYPVSGTFAARLRVTDPVGATGTKSVAVSVANVLPVARLVITPNPATAGETVLVDGSTSSDADGSVVRYDWDLDGNGTFETTTNGTSSLATVYPNVSTVSVGLRVRDDVGGTGIAHVTLKVNAAPTGGGGTGGGGTTGGGTTGGGTTGGGTTGGGDSGGGTGGGTGGDGAVAGTPISASLGGSAVQKAKTVLKKGLALTCRADRAATCTVTATLSATDARRLKLASQKTTKPTVIGSARVTITTAGTKALTLKLSSKAAKALKRSKKVRVTLTGVVTAGADRASVGRAVIVKK